LELKIAKAQLEELKKDAVEAMETQRKRYFFLLFLCLLSCDSEPRGSKHAGFLHLALGWQQRNRMDMGLAPISFFFWERVLFSQFFFLYS
jgi:hypothetical protein